LFSLLSHHIDALYFISVERKRVPAQYLLQLTVEPSGVPFYCSCHYHQTQACHVPPFPSHIPEIMLTKIKLKPNDHKNINRNKKTRQMERVVVLSIKYQQRNKKTTERYGPSYSFTT